MNELWQPVLGYEGLYEVSNLGQVRSVDRTRPTTRHGKATVVKYKGKLLRPGQFSSGYLSVSLWKSNKGVSGSVHVLVAQAFLGDTSGKDVNHIDGDKHNNAAANLEICNRSENMLHAYRTGLWNGNKKIKRSTSLPQPCVV